ncbi:GntR family transcriptional regulator [Paenibacillus sp. KQZ6P-2]|uniref:GntR family transcriptional regulator n=1 Tax=Paenibacillus mangrovi TaxID=2931978 RepID=A0A9X2B6B2_9BACL|nr:GntR family transcriptional regulator [Paenibacillus mangrovi]MCJ8013607.1 GntR family transcriptional regulator [Paenibacillus mangrovi]
MMKFTQIDNLLTADRVYKELKNAILKRMLAPGQKLDIFELAEQFNVSRTPVKEAFNRLRLEGLVVIKPRKGTYVAEIDLHKIIEVLDARIVFETWAAKIGVSNAAQEDFQILQTLCQQMDKHYNDKPFDFMSFNELDIQFHYHIVKMGQNQCMLDLYKGLNAHRITERAYYEIAYEKAKSSHHDHLAIVEAFENRDVDRVLEMITNHIIAGKEGLLRLQK